MWRVPTRSYSAAFTLQEQDKVAWHRLIWSQFHIPKYSLIAWMAILDRLLTISRLSSWGIAIANDRCVLRDPETETRDYLFNLSLL